MQKLGLILMVGATGSGKSTSLSAMLDFRNERKSGHILTLEDPVEFIFTNKKSIVNQREVGTDTKAFEIALKNALRQAPDCILIGEIRDKQTMGMALAYAQSGHLCLATLINFYPLENRPSLLLDLSAALAAVISQRLVRTKAGLRMAAVEVLLNTRHIAELIEKGSIGEIKDALEQSMSPGSQTFEQALFKLFMDGKITQEEAMANADSATNMLWLINQATAGEITNSGAGKAPPAAADKPGTGTPEKKEGALSGGGVDSSFNNFKIDMNA
jgi:twitching motility protein PilU